MASRYSIFVLILLFLTINLISADLVEDICKQTKYPALCNNVYYADDVYTIQSLTEIIINETYAHTTPPIMKIDIILPKTTDAQLKKVYTLCRKYLSHAVSSLNAALDKLKSHDYPSVKMAVHAFSRDIASCRKTFSLAPSKRNELVDYVDSLERYLDVLAVTVSKL